MKAATLLNDSDEFTAVSELFAKIRLKKIKLEVEGGMRGRR